MHDSFKIKFDSFGHSIPKQEQVSRINSFSFMAFKGPVDLKYPTILLAYLEEYLKSPSSASSGTASLKSVYFGVCLGATTSRHVVSKYSLKKRNYLSTTSMDAELSLVTANMALARPNTLLFDPFVGSGSFLVSCAHYGAMGSTFDVIDGIIISFPTMQNILFFCILL